MYIYLTHDQTTTIEKYSSLNGNFISSLSVNCPLTKLYLENLQISNGSSSYHLHDIEEGYILKISTSENLLEDIAYPIFETDNAIKLELQSLIELF
jgi:hypothetical protein